MIHPRSEPIGDAYHYELVAYLVLHTVGNQKRLGFVFENLGVIVVISFVGFHSCRYVKTS